MPEKSHKDLCKKCFLHMTSVILSIGYIKASVHMRKMDVTCCFNINILVFNI